MKWCCWSLIVSLHCAFLLLKILFIYYCKLYLCYQHITYGHPPNKVEFVHYSGINHILSVLKHHVNLISHSTEVNSEVVEHADSMCYYQAIGLLYNIVLVDSHAKINLANIRQLILHEGIVDIVNTIQHAYPLVGTEEHQALHSAISSLLEVIMTDWS